MKKMLKLGIAAFAVGLALVSLDVPIPAWASRVGDRVIDVLTVNQTATVKDNLTVLGILKSTTSITVPYPATETIVADAIVTANACGGVKRVTAATNVTTSTLNTFTSTATVTSPCPMIVVNVGPATITFDNNSTFISSNTANVVLTSSNTFKVIAVQNIGWIQVSGTSQN